MAESKNKQIAREFMESLEKDRIERTRAIIADDIVWHLAQSIKKVLGFPDAIRGADAVIKWLNGLNTSLYKRDENKRFIIHDLIEEGDKIAVVWRLMTETPAGKPYTNDYIYLCRIANDRVCEVTTYNDTAHAYEELLPKT
jgi:ketosteroid isomerase-like protein